MTVTIQMSLNQYGLENMKIKYLCPEGVLEVEQSTLKEIERSLPGNWFGYAGFQLFQRGASQAFDIDLLVFTSNRALVIELKNWSGDIEFEGRQWLHKGVAKKSPVGLTELKARVLKECVREKFGKGVRLPFIEHLVLVCHPTSRLRNFPDSESKFVLPLHEFLTCATDPKRYQKRFPDEIPNFQFKSANPLPDRAKYDTYFAPTNPAIKGRTTVFQGFQQASPLPDYVHPRKIWAEYRAQHVESHRSKALLRKWDFGALAGGSATALERATIGLRELRLNESLRVQAPELHVDLLEPVGSATPEDVTTNFIEGFRLPERAERLAERLSRSPKLALEERVAIAKSVLARFSKLHNLGVAHRDITSKTLWLVEPARVILSTFAAARIPEAKSVGANRVELETGSVCLPEDQSQTEMSTPYLRDVFLLGALIYNIVDDRPLEQVQDVPLFDEAVNLALPKLGPWYAKALNWEPAHRFPTASEALDAFNDALTSDLPPAVEPDAISAFKTTASPLKLPAKEVLSEDSDKTVYVSELRGDKVLVKCWPNLKFDPKNPGRNRRLLEFLETARALRQSSFDAAPDVLDYGVGPFGLILVTKWVEGEPLSAWQARSQTARDKALVGMSLLNSVRRLHAQGVTHGDLKDSNIVVRHSVEGVPEASLLDVLDLSADGDHCVSIGALPAHLDGASSSLRDLHSSVRLAIQLLSPSEFPLSHREAGRAAELIDVPPPLDLLTETLQRELNPPVDTTPRFAIKLRRPRSEHGRVREMESDNGIFPIGFQKLDDGRMVFFITGVREQVIVRCDQGAEVVSDVSVREVGHEMYVSNARRAKFRLHAVVNLESTDSSDATALVETLLTRLEVTREDAAEVDPEIPPPLPTASPYARDGTDNEIGSIATSLVWQALAESDELNAVRITVRPGARKVSGDQYSWLIPFDVEDQGVVDFADDEKIEISERGKDPVAGTETWFRLGKVSPDIGKDTLRVMPTNPRFSPREGATYYLRGSLESSASDKRVAAMQRVLSNGALVPHIASYFEPSATLEPAHFPVPFTAPEMEELYGLNDRQAEALVHCLSHGPISLLQGPPGTGKTKFIASFIHLVLARGLAKNVLLVSQSHEAVNNALEKTSDLASETGTPLSMVRVGQASMVSQRLMPIHEDARRQLYRESFDAEAKARIKAVGQTMGLPEEYVDEAVDVFASLGTILRSIEILEDQSEGNDSPLVQAEARKLRERFVAIAEDRFGIDVAGGPSAALRRVLDEHLDAVAEKHGATSFDLRAKLEQVVWLAAEFSVVLRSPHSNFTSFLTHTAQIVAGTCVGVGRHSLGIVDHSYDWVVVDEAARASPMELVVAMQAGRRVLLVGDHLQLPPLYPGAVEDKTAQILGISRTEFRRINNFKRAFSSPYGQKVGRTLLKQYRMAENINRLVSRCFYEGSLTVARGVPGSEYDHLPEYLAKEVVWVDTHDQGRDAFHRAAGARQGALVNEAEANAVVSVLHDIISAKGFWSRMTRKLEREVPIGIIAMYAEQRDLIRRKLDQAEWAAQVRDLFTVGTVDSYQGKENRIIIVSVVRNDASPRIGFLTDSERINVALSRAQDRLVIVSSTAMWVSRAGTPMNKVLGEFMKMTEEGSAKFVSSINLRRGVTYA